jgi:hypothetical protein
VRSCSCAVEAVELAGLDATALGSWGRAAAPGAPAMATVSLSSIVALLVCLMHVWIRVPGASGVHLANRMTSSTDFILLVCNAIAPTELPWPP